jgi:hypothetical protein
MQSKPSCCSGSSGNSTCTSSLAHLPKELLVLVMRKLSPRQRFGGCALTCRALLAAAVAATEELQLSNICQQRADGIALWLAKHSSEHMTKLNVEGSCLVRLRCGAHIPVKLALPFDRLSRLQDLTLCRLVLQQHPASSSSSSFSSYSPLAMLSGLQRLELSSLPQPTGSNLMGRGASASLSSAAGVAFSAVLGTALGQLVQVTKLSLSTDSGWRLSGLALVLASSLIQLQHLDLKTVGTEEHPVQLQALPGSLSLLSLSDVVVGSMTGISSSSWSLQRLQELELLETDVPPTVLLHMPQLQSLFWHTNQFLEKQELLSVLPKLQQLRSLSLDGVDGPAAASDYAALTASSNLDTLSLYACGLAASAVEHMFGAGRLLPHLHAIGIQATFGISWPDPIEEDDDEDGTYGLVVGPLDAARLAGCCPGLCCLGPLIITDDVTAADLLPLLQLSALTYLELGGAALDDDVAEQVLVKLTGEQVLQRWGSAWCRSKVQHISTRIFPLSLRTAG